MAWDYVRRMGHSTRGGEHWETHSTVDFVESDSGWSQTYFCLVFASSFCCITEMNVHPISVESDLVIHIFSLQVMLDLEDMIIVVLHCWQCF